MSEYPLLSLRKEVLDYLRSSEDLIAASAKRGNRPFSPEELGIVEYYQAEVGKILAPQGQQK